MTPTAPIQAGAEAQLPTGPPPQQPPAGPPQQQTWADIYQTLPHNIPDEAYDSLRNHFFYDKVAPSLTPSGVNLEDARHEFLKQTERPDKQAYPRTAMTATSAMHAAVSPLLGLYGKLTGDKEPKQSVDTEMGQEVGELHQQGINPTPYEMAGGMIGQLPYWGPGMGAAGALGKAAEIGMAGQKAINILAGGLVQGAYDAASADKQPFIAGLKGFGMGAGGVAAFELAGPMWRALKGAHPELSSEAAQSVEDLTLGRYNDAIAQMASEAIADTDHIESTVAQWREQVGKAARKNGIPKETNIQPSKGMVELKVTGADGKSYVLSGSPEEVIKSPNLTDHLEAGGAIEAVNGDQAAVNKFMLLNERLKASDLALEVPLDKPSDTATWLDEFAGPLSKKKLQTIKLPNDEVRRSAANIGQMKESADYSVQGDQTDLREQIAQSAHGKSFDELPLDLKREVDLDVDDVLDTRRWDAKKATRPVVEPDKPLAVDDTVQHAEHGQGTVTEITGEAPEVLHKVEFKSEGQPPAEHLLSEESLTKVSEPEPPKVKQYGVTLEKVPPLDNISMEMQPEPRADTPNVEKVRGSADPELNANGINQASYMAKRLAEKGGLDELHSGDRTRAIQTSGFVLQENPLAAFKGTTEDLNSQRSGYLEGMPAEEGRKVKDAFARETPDVPIPGRSPMTGQPGESLDQVKWRVLPYIKNLMDSFKENPRKIGVTTHFSPINLVDAWGAKGFPDDFQIDTEHYLSHKESTSDVYELIPHGETWRLGKVELDSDTPLKDGIFLIRHGETDMNAPSVKYRETPTIHRFHGDSEVLGGGSGAEIGHPGEKPSIYLAKDSQRDTLFHENFHGHITNLGLRKDVNSLLDDPIVHDIFNGAFDEGSKAIYGTTPHLIPEEVYAFTAAAIRTNDQGTIQAFAEADTDTESVLNWATEKSQALLDRAAEVPDSLHKRTLERRVGAVVARASRQLEDIKGYYSHAGEVDFDGNQWRFTQGDVSNIYTDRHDLINYLEENHQEPLLSPELVDTSALPDGLPRFARKIGNFDGSKPPITSDPDNLSGGEKIKPGGLVFSQFFRTSSDWFSSVATKMDMPELSQTWETIDSHIIQYQNAARPFFDLLKETFKGIERERHTDFFKYFSAAEDAKPAIAQELRFTPEEIAKLEKFKTQFADPLGLDQDSLYDYLVKAAPKLRNGGKIEQIYDRDTALYDMIKTGQLDPKDTDLARIASNYMRGTLNHQIVEPAVNTMRELIKDEKLGQLAPLIGRKLDYIMGRPDFTQEAVAGVVGSAIDAINNGISRVNKFLPDGMHLEHIEDTPKEALDKYLLFSYAGSLAMRPAVLVRNIAELFTTSYPVLGNHLWTGMKAAFEVAKEGRGADAVKQAEKYGALVERQNLSELYAGGGQEGGFEGKMEKLSVAALNYLQWSHNATRLVAFKGFEAKVMDAIVPNLKNPAMFLRDSGLWFAPNQVQKQWAKEFANLKPEGYEDFSRRAASKLVDLTQWNYRRGAQPGLYQYQLGRLFGQYGTWPLNYIEYGRRFLQAGDKQAMVQGLSRLALAHGSILAMGHGAGIDTSHWVFTGPMGWEGSPIFQSLIAAPTALTAGPRGAEARKEVLEVVDPMSYIPGAEEFGMIYKSITSEDPHQFMRMFGFTPLEGK